MDYDERRQHQRYPAKISVDITHEGTHLYSYIENISEMGVFIHSDQPVPVGTELLLLFNELELKGEVRWVGDGGMGIAFVDPSAEQRQKVHEIVSNISYLIDDVD